MDNTNLINCYYYDGKSSYTKVLDFILTPTRIAKECNTYQYTSSGTFTKIESVSGSIFLKYLCNGLAVILIPLTSIICYLKSHDEKTKAISDLFLKHVATTQSANAPSQIQQKATEQPQKIAEKVLDFERVKYYLDLDVTDESYRTSLPQMKPEDYKNLSLLMKDFQKLVSSIIDAE